MRAAWMRGWVESCSTVITNIDGEELKLSAAFGQACQSGEKTGQRILKSTRMPLQRGSNSTLFHIGLIRVNDVLSACESPSAKQNFHDYRESVLKGGIFAWIVCVYLKTAFVHHELFKGGYFCLVCVCVSI